MVVLPLSYFDLTVCFLFIFLSVLWVRLRRPVNFPPGPTAFPVIGNFHNISDGDFLKAVRNLRKQYGDIFSLSLGSFWIVVVCGRDNLRELLVKRGDLTVDRPPLYLFSLAKNKGIGSSSGSPWKHQRTFALSKLREFGFGKRSFESSVCEELNIFLDLLDSYKGCPFDIYNILQTSLSNIVMSITVGRRFEYNDPKFTRFVNILNENFRSPAFRGPLNFIPFLGKLPGDLFGAKQLERNANQLFDFFRSEIADHEKSLDENNIRDFIDAYLVEMKSDRNKGKDIYTGEQLESVIGDLFAAGTETTATTIRWAIVFMLNDPDVQQKMRKELNEVVGCGRLPNMSDKSDLPYCEAVVLESLRLGNIIPFSLPHHVSEDIHYKGYTIPKDSVLMPSLDSVVYDEHLFPDCHTFKPERFIDSSGKICGQENVLTFSLGRRVCLGEALARMELFLYLTAFVQRFDFLPPEGENPPSIHGNLGITYSPDLFKFKAVSHN